MTKTRDYSTYQYIDTSAPRLRTKPNRTISILHSSSDFIMTNNNSSSRTTASTSTEAAPLSPRPADKSSSVDGSVEVVMPSSPTSILSLDVYLLLDNEDIQHIKNDTDSESVVPCFYYMSDDDDNDDDNEDDDNEEQYIAHRDRDILQPSPLRHYHYQKDDDPAVLMSNNSSLRSVSSFGSQDFPSIHLEYSLDEDEEELEEAESEDELEIYDTERERTNSKKEALVDGLVGLGCLPEVASDIFATTTTTTTSSNSKSYCRSIQCLS